MLARSIFPARHPASIVDEYELNFCVRDGNRWTLVPISTNYLGYTLKTEHQSNTANHGRQMSLHSTNCRSSPRAISTGRLNTLLRLHRWPINEVIFFDPYSIMDGRSYLRGSFTLRCLQRLSRPDVATQLCRWHDNWCTRGLSIPVLSY